MLKTRIIASDVCSLTDARYFSAWGVDILSFNCDPNQSNYIDQETLNEIREWVEGPQIAGSFLNDINIEEHIASRNLDAVILDNDTSINLVSVPVIKKLKFSDFETFHDDDTSTPTSIVLEASIENLDSILNRDPGENTCYLDIAPLDVSVINRVVENGKYGLVLKGSEEEKVGFKSFDFLDDVYDLLMD